MARPLRSALALDRDAPSDAAGGDDPGKLGDVVGNIRAVDVEAFWIGRERRGHPPYTGGKHLGSAATSSGFTVDLWKEGRAHPTWDDHGGVFPRGASRARRRLPGGLRAGGDFAMSIMWACFAHPGPARSALTSTLRALVCCRRGQSAPGELHQVRGRFRNGLRESSAGRPPSVAQCSKPYGPVGPEGFRLPRRLWRGRWCILPLSQLSARRSAQLRHLCRDIA
jgi:hypothetical protein